MKLQQQLGGTEDQGVIQVVSRAFAVLSCFDGPSARLGNGAIADRCGLPRSTVSRLTATLTRIGQLVYLPQERKYAVGPNALALGALLGTDKCNEVDRAGEMGEANEGILSR